MNAIFGVFFLQVFLWQNDKMSSESNGDQNIPVLEENKTKAEEAKEAANKLFQGLKF